MEVGGFESRAGRSCHVSRSFRRWEGNAHVPVTMQAKRTVSPCFPFFGSGDTDGLRLIGGLVSGMTKCRNYF